MMSLFIGSPSFCKFETSMALQNLKMNAQDFHYILSWEAGNNTETPTYYRVGYTNKGPVCQTSPKIQQSKSSQKDQVKSASLDKSSSEWKMVEECSNITRLFCNLTEELDFCSLYIILVQPSTRNGTNETLLFTPYGDTCITPQFNISACSNCINVTVKLSSSLLKLYQELDYTVSVATTNFLEKRIRNSTKIDSFYEVLENMSLNTNYCISVDVTSSASVGQCTQSPPKCITIGSKDKSGHVTFPALGGVIISLGVALVLLLLYMAGGFCLKEQWPEVLEITTQLDYSLFESCPEEVNTIQVFQKRKKKVWECIDDDDEDDDDEDDGSEGDVGYTKHRLLSKISKSCSNGDNIQLSTDCSSTKSDCQIIEPLDAEVDNLPYDNKEETTTCQVLCIASETNATSIPEPENSDCLNVNLSTVTLGIPTKTWVASATLTPYQEDAADIQEPCISETSEPKHFTDTTDMQSSSVHNLSCAWQNSNGSGQSESSDSETDCVGDYMRR
ncbi:interferon alpha/beta receptor 2 isoform X2 [Hemicordylus capensis]|uniref:interferon alpha/beta receptor 2 isoform X2 n=1 Tax=Hemicordylus capensis TaxID=884348 RepID=UPI0023029249|nr:interferon alpha/beta receptor 2 isoform X2 [Hemicordylus capensis]